MLSLPDLIVKLYKYTASDLNYLQTIMSGNVIPLPPSFQPLTSPNGTHRWLLKIPSMEPGPDLIPNLGIFGGQTEAIKPADTISLPSPQFAIINVDTKKVLLCLLSQSHARITQIT